MRRLRFSSQNSLLLPFFSSIAFNLSHGLIPWNIDIRCLKVFRPFYSDTTQLNSTQVLRPDNATQLN